MKTITAKEFDEKFDQNEDITKYLDSSSVKKLNDFESHSYKTKKVNVDFPENIIMLLDKEAKKIGVTRQSIIKMWIAQRLKEEQKYQLVG
jgi:predicted DNA binding CopG/RHH family protein